MENPDVTKGGKRGEEIGAGSGGNDREGNVTKAKLISGRNRVTGKKGRDFRGSRLKPCAQNWDRCR